MSSNLFVTESPDPDNIIDTLGVRGSLLYELCELKLNTPPAFIIDSAKFKVLDSLDLEKIVDGALSFLESKKRNDCEGERPLLFKVLLSPSVDLSGSGFASLHNVGLNESTVENYAGAIDDPDFAYSEFKHLLVKLGELFAGEAPQVPKELPSKEACEKLLNGQVDFESDINKLTAKLIRSLHESYYSDPTNEEVPCSVIVQAMVFGHTGKGSCAGQFTTRNLITGEDKIEGNFSPNSFDLVETNTVDIGKAHANILEQIKTCKNVLEKKFKNIIEVSFIFENHTLWIMRQRVSSKASLVAQLKLNLDLRERGDISKSELINFLKPEQLASLLYPVVNESSVGDIPVYKGGIAGSLGSARGRLFTSTEKFMAALVEDKGSAHAQDLILCMPSTYATDVKAIELGRGVISSEGGYASHAPVVARSLGKPAVVIDKLEFGNGGVRFPNGTFVKDGDVISFEITKTASPTIYFGSVQLVHPDFEKNGLYRLMDIASTEIKDFYVRCNADNVREAAIGKRFGARGIGLCRTEHMFFGTERIMNLIWLFCTEDCEERKNPLRILKDFQRHDFLEIFNELGNNAVTIRLMDAPLHEFIPHSPEEVANVFNFLKSKGVETDEESMQAKFDGLKESNPMLGHRGVRLAISYSDIYEMQTEAIIEGALESNLLNDNRPEVEIMVPFIMSDSEFKFIRNGKNIEGTTILGINGVIEKIKNRRKLDKLPFPVKIGVMIETPASALNAGYLSQQADFFSFGTNDLTQMTHGLSRDDINAFLPSYTQYDIFNSNPFQVLTTPVKELIRIAKNLGKMFRPDIKLGLCGEHGASEENIDFCIKTGLDYVSCSCYSVPVAILSVVQHGLKNSN